MGIWIRIRKYQLQNNIHYYQVELPGSEMIPFFIGIDPLQRKLYFFKNNNFKEKPISTVNFNNKEEILSIPEEFIPQSIFGNVVIKVIGALRKNEFPEILDHAA